MQSKIKKEAYKKTPRQRKIASEKFAGISKKKFFLKEYNFWTL